MSLLRNTRVDLPEHTREAAIAVLNQHVLDLRDLFIQTKLAHWNVRGSHF